MELEPRPTKIGPIINKFFKGDLVKLGSAHHSLIETPTTLLRPYLNRSEELAFLAALWQKRDDDPEFVRSLNEDHEFSLSLIDLYNTVMRTPITVRGKKADGKIWTESSFSNAYAWLNTNLAGIEVEELTPREKAIVRKLNPFPKGTLEERLEMVGEEEVKKFITQAQCQTNEYVYEVEYTDPSFKRKLQGSLNPDNGYKQVILQRFLTKYPGKKRQKTNARAYSTQIAASIAAKNSGYVPITFKSSSQESLF